MSYEHNMSEEVAPKRKVLIPEGNRATKITACEEKVSKSGNDMFVFTFMDKKLEKEYEVYAVATPKKRYFLKQILSACGVTAGEDGIYKWDIKDVLGKEISVLIEHEPNEFINREGITVKGTQHRVAEVNKSDTVAWDE